jgi:hypothetical protein
VQADAVTSAPVPSRIFLGTRFDVSASKELLDICKDKKIPLSNMEMADDKYELRATDEKGKIVEFIVEVVIIQFSCLRLVEVLPRLVEPLQVKVVLGETHVQTSIVGCHAHGLLQDPYGFLILPT